MHLENYSISRRCAGIYSKRTEGLPRAALIVTVLPLNTFSVQYILDEVIQLLIWEIASSIFPLKGERGGGTGRVLMIYLLSEETDLLLIHA